MNEVLAWQVVDPQETIEFWFNYLQNKPLPVAKALEYTGQAHSFVQERVPGFLGPAVQHSGKSGIEHHAVISQELSTATMADFLPRHVDAPLRGDLPYSAVGKLLFAFVVNNEWQVFGGSAFVLDTADEQFIFTAAHCLFSEQHIYQTRQWAQHVVFIPLFETASRSLLSYFETGAVYAANGLGVARAWYESGLQKYYDYDWGCIRLEPGKANLREQTSALGYIGGDFDTTQFTQGLSVGYPLGTAFEGAAMWETQFEMAYLQFVGGHAHIRMKGNRLSAGASGGPVLVSSYTQPRNWYAIGLNACIANYGPEFPYWDSPRFGVQFLNMIPMLSSLSLPPVARSKTQ